MDLKSLSDEKLIETLINNAMQLGVGASGLCIDPGSPLFRKRVKELKGEVLDRLKKKREGNVSES